MGIVSSDLCKERYVALKDDILQTIQKYINKDRYEEILKEADSLE